MTQYQKDEMHEGRRVFTNQPARDLMAEAKAIERGESFAIPTTEHVNYLLREIEARDKLNRQLSKILTSWMEKP